MGGRGRGGGGGQTARVVASALGIARHEMANFTPKMIVEPPPLYPVLKRTVLPVEDSEDLQHMAELKADITERFRQSPFFLDEKETKDIRRYSDKYYLQSREKLLPDFSRVPEELCWMKEKRGEMKAKRAKLDDTGSEKLREKLEKLEAQEGGEAEEEKEAEEGGSDSEESERAEPEAVSEDEGEEDNDYISNYFDNGEGYGDAGSDDNMDGEEF